MEYAVIARNGPPNIAQLQMALDQAVYQMAYILPFNADGCKGQPPVMAHPEVLLHPRPYAPELELSLFDLTRVDAYLATFTWRRLANMNPVTTISQSQAVQPAGWTPKRCWASTVAHNNCRCLYSSTKG